ncbi:hypothetical protein DFP72DRAFT_589460 [Ephemerocybe angulata]|uniref:Uncharacterized protein n=1 Tax=Ephemerocybe angulata TaxID=980116 RepID=A0A8H6HJL0_9AGAR|nr:hypothetical protein DFP72DRAFT_589460 [Tulosesus angulatus]
MTLTNSCNDSVFVFEAIKMNVVCFSLKECVPRSLLYRITSTPSSPLPARAWVHHLRCQHRQGKWHLREQDKVFYGEHVKYRAEFQGLWKGMEKWGKAVANDELNNRLGADVSRLTPTSDSNSSLRCGRTSTRLSSPSLSKSYPGWLYPHPPHRDQLDLVVENLRLQGRNLLPKIVEMEAKN